MIQKLTLDQAMMVITALSPNRKPVYGTEYRVDRPTVETDLWYVISPPLGVQVKIFQKLEGEKEPMFVGDYIFSETGDGYQGQRADNDILLFYKLWPLTDYAWRFDIPWLQDQYEEVSIIREEIKSLIKPLTNFIGEDVKDYEAAIDSLLQTCQVLGIKDKLKFIKFIKFLATEYPKQ